MIPSRTNLAIFNGECLAAFTRGNISVILYIIIYTAVFYVSPFTLPLALSSLLRVSNIVHPHCILTGLNSVHVHCLDVSTY